MLQRAYQIEYDLSYTDDASVAEKNGIDIKLIQGEITNIKITTSFDIVMAEHLVNILAKR